MNQYIIENSNLRISSTFYKALLNFRTQSNVMLVYSILKVISGAILSIISVSGSCPLQLIDIWLLLVGIQSLISIWCYVTVKKIMKQLENILKIADDLRQTVILPLEENIIIPLNEDDLICAPEIDPNLNLLDQEETKRISILTTQIKYEASKKDQYLKWISQLMFVMNQVLIIFGFVQVFQTSGQNLCKNGTEVFMYMFLILAVYQYIDLYVILILLLICLPFIIIFLIYQSIKNCQKKKKNSNFIQKLQSNTIQYQPGTVEGDGDCRICLQAYNLNDKIIILPCNKLHHFHSNCISVWLNVESNCPLCRSTFGAEENDAQQLQQQLIINDN